MRFDPTNRGLPPVSNRFTIMNSMLAPQKGAEPPSIYDRVGRGRGMSPNPYVDTFHNLPGHNMFSQFEGLQDFFTQPRAKPTDEYAPMPEDGTPTGFAPMPNYLAAMLANLGSQRSFYRPRRPNEA